MKFSTVFISSVLAVTSLHSAAAAPANEERCLLGICLRPSRHNHDSHEHGSHHHEHGRSWHESPRHGPSRHGHDSPSHDLHEHGVGSYHHEHGRSWHEQPRYGLGSSNLKHDSHEHGHDAGSQHHHHGRSWHESSRHGSSRHGHDSSKHDLHEHGDGPHHHRGRSWHEPSRHGSSRHGHDSPKHDLHEHGDSSHHHHGRSWHEPSRHGSSRHGHDSPKHDLHEHNDGSHHHHGRSWHEPSRHDSSRQDHDSHKHGGDSHHHKHERSPLANRNPPPVKPLDTIGSLPVVGQLLKGILGQILANPSPHSVTPYTPRQMAALTDLQTMLFNAVHQVIPTLPVQVPDVRVGISDLPIGLPLDSLPVDVPFQAGDHGSFLTGLPIAPFLQSLASFFSAIGLPDVASPDMVTAMSLTDDQVSKLSQLKSILEKTLPKIVPSDTPVSPSDLPIKAPVNPSDVSVTVLDDSATTSGAPDATATPTRTEGTNVTTSSPTASPSA